MDKGMDTDGIVQFVPLIEKWDKKNTIAIVDSGISEAVYQQNKAIILSNNKLCSSNTDWDETNHGTGVFRVMNKLNPNLNFIIIKIFANSAYTSFSSLVKAIIFCVNNDYKFINLSLAADSATSLGFSERLLISNLLQQANIGRSIFIAAGNGGAIDAQFPASLAGSLGFLNCFCVSATDHQGTICSFSSCKAKRILLFYIIIFLQNRWK